MAVERRLTEIVGAVGGKLHTARSRNDQVATDMAMFTRAHALRAIEALADLQTVIVQVAEAHLDWPMPGYTHLQRAQPVYLSATTCWPTSGCSGATPSASRPCSGSTDRAAAGRRRAGGRELPDRPPPGGVRARVRGRGAELDRRASPTATSCSTSSAAAATCATHLSRLGAEIVLWSSEEFGFAEVRDDWASSSSIMPQKKNPDAAELLRAKAPRIVAHLAALHGVMHAPPADLQQGHAGGQGAPLRHRRHARAVPGGGARDARRDRRSSASAWPAPRPTRCSRRSTSPTCSSSAACRSASRTGSSPAWSARRSTPGRTLSQLTPRGARAARRRPRRRVLLGAIPRVVARVQGERGRDVAGRGARAAGPRPGGAGLDVLKASFYDRPVLDGRAGPARAASSSHGDDRRRDRRDRGLPLHRAGLPRPRRHHAAHARPARRRPARPTSTAPTASTRC